MGILIIGYAIIYKARARAKSINNNPDPIITNVGESIPASGKDEGTGVPKPPEGVEVGFMVGLGEFFCPEGDGEGDKPGLIEGEGDGLILGDSEGDGETVPPSPVMVMVESKVSLSRGTLSPPISPATVVLLPKITSLVPALSASNLTVAKVPLPVFAVAVRELKITVPSDVIIFAVSVSRNPPFVTLTALIISGL